MHIMGIQDKSPRKFRLTIVNADSHERLWSVPFTRAKMVTALASVAITTVIGVYFLVAYTPIRSFIPGYPDAGTRRRAIQNAQRIDSLRTYILQWELYAENLRRVVAGQEPVKIDTLIKDRNTERVHIDAAFLAEREARLRAEVAEQDQFDLVDAAPQRNLPIEALSFFSPVKGKVTERFNGGSRRGIRIVAAKTGMVKSILDGDVVYSQWDAENGHTLILQHENSILSILRHCGKPMKKLGDAVKAGTPICAVPEVSGKPQPFQLELWYQGEAVDPTIYVSF